MRIPRLCEEDGSRAAGRCTLCGEEIYAGQTVWRIGGETVCPGCFPAFARMWPAGYEITLGAEADITGRKQSCVGRCRGRRRARRRWRGWRSAAPPTGAR